MSMALVDLADRWGLRLSEEKWEGFRLACQAIVDRAVAEAEARLTDIMLCGHPVACVGARPRCLVCVAVEDAEAQARADEREACALVCREFDRPLGSHPDAAVCAYRIAARGEAR